MSKPTDNLALLARKASLNAYAPYSNFQVGAALSTSDDQVFTGCNVENASYGMTLCAERNAISTAVSAGIKPGEIQSLAFFIDQPDHYSPCGACRQVMSEFMAGDAKVTAVNSQGDEKHWTVAQLLPDGFSLEN